VFEWLLENPRRSTMRITNALILRAMARVKSSDDTGATAVEYGLLVALIAAVIVVTVGLLGTEVLEGFQAVLTALTP
jgi:pilus assembly protein Flp/PilA